MFLFVQHRLIAPVNLYFKNISYFQFNTLNSKYSSIATINSRRAPAADSPTCLSRASRISNGISLVQREENSAVSQLRHRRKAFSWDFLTGYVANRLFAPF